MSLNRKFTSQELGKIAIQIDGNFDNSHFKRIVNELSASDPNLIKAVLSSKLLIIPRSDGYLISFRKSDAPKTQD